jgi:threonine dehydrogenase-like Zn-dependent dehydrogenase
MASSCFGKRIENGALTAQWVFNEELVEKLVRGNLHPEQLVTDTFSLEQAKEAYETFDAGSSGKVAIVF